ncbi:MAG: hypothetical protein J7K39_00745 [Bacteroidales bacterium]|nr:hypothetical protein [Bacteroidales bacterium]
MESKKRTIKKIEFDKILEILKEEDQESVYQKTNIIPDSGRLYKTLENYINPTKLSRQSVLGIDIYRYGMFRHLEQTLIPSIFKIFFDKTIHLCLQSNEFIFQHYDKKKIENSFISTGDGGFLILDTPLHSVLFAINFEIVVRAYNSYHLFPKLRNIIGAISLRYAITYDALFSFDDNFYGSAIINNSRILDKDSLNRCLLDENTYNWFLTNIDGIENLQVYTIQDVSNIFHFQNYDHKYLESGINEIIDNEYSRYKGIINADILKVGQIQAKEMQLNIYNLHLQVSLNISSSIEADIKRLITISLGNLNTTGI